MVRKEGVEPSTLAGQASETCAYANSLPAGRQAPLQCQIKTCGRRESNPQPLRDRFLRPARMPIPPLPLGSLFNRNIGLMGKPGVLGDRANEAVMAILLKHMRRPSGHTTDRKHRRKKIDGDADNIEH